MKISKLLLYTFSLLILCGCQKPREHVEIGGELEAWLAEFEASIPARTTTDHYSDTLYTKHGLFIISTQSGTIDGKGRVSLAGESQIRGYFIAPRMVWVDSIQEAKRLMIEDMQAKAELPTSVYINQAEQQNRAEELPALFKKREFSTRDLVEGANHFISMGAVKGLGSLRSLAFPPRMNEANYSKLIIDRNERIGWLCRIIFESKTNEPLRQPDYGALNLPWRQFPLKSWPLYPVALSGDSFFVLSEGYNVEGRPEWGSAYIDYCRKNGVFRTKLLPLPTREEAIRDFQQLVAAQRWTKIKWKAPSEPLVKGFIQGQAKRTLISKELLLEHSEKAP